MDLGKDGISGGGPHEGDGAVVVVSDEELDFADELGDAGEGAAADGHLGDDAEPAFDLVDSSPSARTLQWLEPSRGLLCSAVLRVSATRSSS